MEISIRNLVHLIVQLTRYEGEVRWDTTKPNGQPRRALDTSKAARLFDFRARTPLEEGLRGTIAWYEEIRRRRAVTCEDPVGETARKRG